MFAIVKSIKNSDVEMFVNLFKIYVHVQFLSLLVMFLILPKRYPSTGKIQQNFLRILYKKTQCKSKLRDGRN